MVAKLVMKSTTGEREEIPLTKETTTIGRKPSNDIHIDNLSVSGSHAQVITILEDSFLEDLGSTNGTYVNGKLIKKHALENGDKITLGKYQISYENSSAGSEKDFEQTMIIRPGEAGMPEEAGSKEIEKSVQKISAAIASEVASSKNQIDTSKSACLQLLSGANAGKELILKKALTTIGQPGVQVAAITRRPHGYFLIHVDGGPNNTVPKVAGSPIGSNAHPLKDHDIIEVAGVKMEFYTK
ncbi:MAG: FHA domain-containing protein [Gammaproteobacteria bacterium]|nr:FHA domain-containing protein [Gammaproteobacteria bacterium]MBL6999530.1 FHA domain-containing protein [Gammaproteobacteria bacterium]